MFGENKLNLILVVAAVLVILVGWQFLMPLIMPEPKPAPPREVTAESQQPGQSSTESTSQSQTTADGVTVDSATVEAVDRSAAIAADQRIIVDGARVRGSILLKGARFDDVTLKDYREQLPKDSPNINVFSPRNSEHPYFAEMGWTQDADSAVALPDSETVWQSDHTVLKTGSPVTLHWDNGQGL
ncbi:MAG: membrane protein insertase YidC, partial [Rhodospirillaceae bacterium]|nr:membrane protein insertase YidC [Rhodospirillaceae bacterium]